MSARCLGLLFAALLLPVCAGAQESFDSLAHAAEAALDARPAEAATLYRKALGIRPGWAEGWMYLGAALYQSNQFAEATDAFRKGIEMVPNIGTAWAYLGLSEAEIGSPEQAIADIRKGQELGLGNNAPFETAVRVRAARLLTQSGAFDEAQQQLQPLAARGETAPPIVEAMGFCALADTSAPNEVTPLRRSVAQLAGSAAWASVTQHPAKAKAGYQQLLAKFSAEPGVHYAYGLYVMETDLAGALAEFRKEMEINPKHWPALVLSGSLMIRQGEADAAIAAFRDAMKRAPTRYRWLCHAEIGHAHLIADRIDAAITELQTALRMSPNQAQIHFLLSQAYRRAGRKDDARKETAEFERLKVQQDPLGVPGLRALQGR